MPPRSFYFPENFEHIEAILRDAHGPNVEDLFARFEVNGMPPLVSEGSLAQALGVSTRLIFSIIKRKEKHYRRFKIQKANGGTRNIASPRTYLKVIQWWILDNILRKVEFPENITGFVRGRGVQANANFHVGANHVLNMDLKDFFPSVSIGRVRSSFRSLGYDEVVANQLSEICTLDDCLPQGAPTSPSLANIAASDLDRSLIDFARKWKMKYTRYADDLTFSSMKFISEEFKDGIVLKINNCDFSVNERKTRFCGHGGRMEVTGLVVNSHVQPPRQWRNKVRMFFFQATKHPEEFRDRLDELNGYVGAINAFVPQGKDHKLLTMGSRAISAVKGVLG